MLAALADRPRIAASAAPVIAFALRRIAWRTTDHLEMLSACCMPLALLGLASGGGRRLAAWRAGLLGLLAAAGADVASTTACVLASAAAYLPVRCSLVTNASRQRPGGCWMPLIAGMVMPVILLVVPYAMPYRPRARRSAGGRASSPWSPTPGNYLSRGSSNALYRDRWCDIDVIERCAVSGRAAGGAGLVGGWRDGAPAARSSPRMLCCRRGRFDLSLGVNGCCSRCLRDCVVPYRGLRVPARADVLIVLARRCRVLAAWRSRRRGDCDTAVRWVERRSCRARAAGLEYRVPSGCAGRRRPAAAVTGSLRSPRPNPPRCRCRPRRIGGDLGLRRYFMTSRRIGTWPRCSTATAATTRKATAVPGWSVEEFPPRAPSPPSSGWA